MDHRAASSREAARLLLSLADVRIRRCAAGAVLLVIAAGAVSALTPLALKALVDGLSAQASVGAQGAHGSALEGLRWIATYLALISAGRLLADIKPLVAGRIEQGMYVRLALRFFEHVLRLPMAYLLGRRNGELIQSLSLATAGCQLFLTHLVNSTLPVVVEMLTMTLVLIHLGQPALVGVFAAMAVAYLFIVAWARPHLKRSAREVSDSSLELHAQLGEGIAYAETLRCFVAEAQASERAQRAGATLESRWSSLSKLQGQVALAISVTFCVSMSACLVIAAQAAAKGTLSVGGFVLVVAYTLQVVRPLELLSGAARDIARALGFLTPLIEVLSVPIGPDPAHPIRPTGTSDRAPGPVSSTAPRIRIENLHFGYALEQPVFKGLSLELEAGCTTVLVGASGCGKSTLARLLMRLHDADAGQILIDDLPIAQMDAAALRSQIALIPQDTTLLHTSMAENIALGIADADPSSIHAAALQARLGTLLDRLPQGLETSVGERGLQLSGGERQRVAIARALLRSAKLWVLDEPTSMLDSRTEAEVLQSLGAMTAGCTTLVIAHRLATVQHADKIAVLDQGQIREQGTHAALLAAGGLYARMWQRQQSQD